MTSESNRLPALDWMRGLVMILMTVDHADSVFNPSHLMTDSVAMYQPGMPLPPAAFLTRWMTHLCAPTFLFLAGTSLALSLGRRAARGEAGLGRHVLVRGMLIALLDPTLLTASWYVGSPAPVVPIILQVLYAIGVAMILMVPIRRLPSPVLLAGALGFFALSDWITLGLWPDRSWGASLPVALTLTPGYVPFGWGALVIVYPALPWFAMLVLGWVFGGHLRRLRSERRSPAPTLLYWGAGALLLFGVVRGVNGYGNMALPREDGSLIQWLHVSKYPPSLSFASLELGLMAVLMAGLFLLPGRRPVRRGNPFHVFGRTALFFYVLHIPLLVALGKVTGLAHRGGLGATYGFTLLALALLYPACVLYGRYKETRPDGWTRFL